MVNYRRVACEVVAVLALAAVAASAPTDCKDGHYDQRQNGTENYRLHVDGVVVAVMPVESLAESLLDVLPDINGLTDLEDLSELYQKPKPPTPAVAVPNPPTPAVAAPSPPEEPLLMPKPEDKPQPAPEKPTEVEAPAKPAESPLSDVSMDAKVKSQKKDAALAKQKRAQRVKNFLANVLVPLLRRSNRQH